MICRDEKKHIKSTFSELLGKELTDIIVSEDKDTMIFKCTDNTVYILYHEQSCCEAVCIEDICGDLDNLIGSPITMAEIVCNHEDGRSFIGNGNDCFTWSFYKLATVKGYVTIRWWGESNGCYSEDVDFVQDISGDSIESIV